MIREGEYYISPDQRWDENICSSIVKRFTSDGLGTRNPWPGMLWGEYGRIRYNGGCCREGDWWEGEERPLPIVPPKFLIIRIPTWGYRLVRRYA